MDKLKEFLSTKGYILKTMLTPLVDSSKKSQIDAIASYIRVVTKLNVSVVDLDLTEDSLAVTFNNGLVWVSNGSVNSFVDNSYRGTSKEDSGEISEEAKNFSINNPAPENNSDGDVIKEGRLKGYRPVTESLLAKNGIPYSFVKSGFALKTDTSSLYTSSLLDETFQFAIEHNDWERFSRLGINEDLKPFVRHYKFRSKGLSSFYGKFVGFYVCLAFANDSVMLVVHLSKDESGEFKVSYAELKDLKSNKVIFSFDSIELGSKYFPSNDTLHIDFKGNVSIGSVGFQSLKGKTFKSINGDYYVELSFEHEAFANFRVYKSFLNSSYDLTETRRRYYLDYEIRYANISENESYVGYTGAYNITFKHFNEVIQLVLDTKNDEITEGALLLAPDGLSRFSETGSSLLTFDSDGIQEFNEEALRLLSNN